MTSTATELPDPDILVPDEEGSPDHDESVSPWVVPDPDESTILTPGRGTLSLVMVPPTQRDASGAPDVRFSREIHPGMHGNDVLGHKRAFSRARPDLYPWPPEGKHFTDLAGDFFFDQVVKYKKQNGLGTARVLGGVTHEKFERTVAKGKPGEWAFDDLAIKLCQKYWDDNHITPDQRVRNAIVQAGFFWYAHRMSIAYSQYRPFYLGKPPFVPHFWDCSAFTTNCHYAGGAPNPNGRPWDHLGYTGTLMSRGTRVGSVNDLDKGDMIFYGSTRSTSAAFPAGSPTHVALYVGKVNGVHMVLSMGSYPMKYQAYNYRHDVNHFRHYKVV